jgi:hypothetical protein
MLFMSNLVIYVKSCYSCQIMSFASNHQIMPFMLNHAIHVKSCDSCHHSWHSCRHSCHHSSLLVIKSVIRGIFNKDWLDGSKNAFKAFGWQFCKKSSAPHSGLDKYSIKRRKEVLMRFCKPGVCCDGITVGLDRCGRCSPHSNAPYIGYNHARTSLRESCLCVRVEETTKCLEGGTKIMSSSSFSHKLLSAYSPPWLVSRNTLSNYNLADSLSSC